MRNGFRAGLEVVGVPEEIPTFREFAGIAEIVSRVNDPPRLAGRNVQDSVDLLALQQLAKAFLPGKGITGLQSEAVPGVEITVAVLQIRTRAVLREPVETAQGTVVEAMTVRVTGCKVQTVRSALGKGCLQAIVGGMAKVRILVDNVQIGV